MSGQRFPAKAQLRRSLSEQLRDSTAKAWDLLWRNVRERRLAGQSAGALGNTCLGAPERGDSSGAGGGAGREPRYRQHLSGSRRLRSCPGLAAGEQHVAPRAGCFSGDRAHLPPPSVL